MLEKSDAVRRAKTNNGRRAMLHRDAKLVENPKTLLVLKGHATSGIVTDVLGNLHIMKKPNSHKLQRKNELLPFEAGGETHLENLARLNDASLFALGNHTKKRPHNLVLGRTFGFRILDMIEFGITNYKPMSAFSRRVSSAPGSMPCVLFNGDDYQTSENTEKLQSLLTDVFRGPHDVENINLSGIDRVLTFTLEAPRIGGATVMVRQFAIDLKKVQGSDLPGVDLVEVGPSFDLTVRRSQFAPPAMMKEAIRTAKDPSVETKRKNISKNEMGDKLGQIHLGKQDLSSMTLARMKGLGRKRSHGADGALPGSAIADGEDGEDEDDSDDGDFNMNKTANIDDDKSLASVAKAPASASSGRRKRVKMA
jgi:ribosome production factor 2